MKTIHMKYRIVVETEMSGKKNFYVQRKALGFLWLYLTVVKDMTMARYRLRCDSLEVAEDVVKSEIERRHQEKQRTVIAREILNVHTTTKNDNIAVISYFS